ncbi:hypothetical protein D3C77_548840 [compost metagenome]
MVSVASQQMSETVPLLHARNCLNFMKAIGRLREKQERLVQKFASKVISYKPVCKGFVALFLNFEEYRVTTFS